MDSSSSNSGGRRIVNPYSNSNRSSQNRNPYYRSTKPANSNESNQHQTGATATASSNAAAWNNAAYQVQQQNDLGNAAGTANTSYVSTSTDTVNSTAAHLALPPQAPPEPEPDPPFIGTPWMPPAQAVSRKESHGMSVPTPANQDSTNNNGNMTSTFHPQTEQQPQVPPQPMQAQQHPPQPNPQHQQHQALLAQIQALQEELQAKEEANFDLSATIATLEAEKQVAIDSVKQKAKDDVSKLQHSLRLEQQTISRLKEETSQKRKKIQTLEEQVTTFRLEQQQQQQQSHQYQHRSSTPPPPIQQVSIPNNNNNADEDPNELHIHRPTTDTIQVTSPTLPIQHNNTPDETRSLALHLLQICYIANHNNDTDVSSAQQVLASIAYSQESSEEWTLSSLARYLLTTKSARLVWYPMIQVNRRIRQAIVTALLRMDETHDKEAAAQFSAKSRAARRRSRITPLNSSGKENVNSNNMDDDDGHQDTSQDDDETFLETELVHDWLQNQLLTTTDDESSPQTTTLSFQLLNILLYDTISAHSCNLFWKLIVAKVVDAISFIHKPRYSAWYQGRRGDRRLRRRLPVSDATNNIYNVETNHNNNGTTTNNWKHDDDKDDKLLSASLCLLNRLIQVTHFDAVKGWYYDENQKMTASDHYDEDHMEIDDDSGSPVVTEESVVANYTEGLTTVCRILDMYEMTIDYHQETPWELPCWYPDGIALFCTIGRTSHAGMTLLRTRVVDLTTIPTNGGSWMPNVLDVAIRQLFALSLLEEEDTTKPIVAPILCSHHQTALEGWVRLWHQVLYFVQTQQKRQQEQESPIKNAAISPSFRSLLLDYQDYYTAACARLLTDPSIRQDIQSMIRAQLEELQFDEEEVEEIKSNRYHADKQAAAAAAAAATGAF